MEVLKDRPEVLQSIQEVAKEEGIKNCEVLKATRNDKGEGFLGEVYMITVRDAKTKKELELVAKVAFLDDHVRKMAPIRKSFQNEIFFYNGILPVYKEFTPIDFIPKCLKASTEDQQELLILENLKSQGFDTFGKKVCLDDDHVSLIFKTYGKFHAVSYVLRDQHPEKFEHFGKTLYNLYDEFTKNDYFNTYQIEINKSVAELLIPGEDDVIIEKFRKYLGRAGIDHYLELINEEVDCPAILHGDCWSNNMLFKYKNTPTGKKPTDIRLIDFQIVKIGSPACDLSYCLYSGASKSVFDNLNQHLQTYHQSFSKCVKELGCDPDKLFPFSKLKEHWKRYSIFGMLMSFGILKMKLIDKEDIVDFTDVKADENMEEMMEQFSNVKFDKDGYAKRIRGMLWHLSEVGAL